MGHSGKEEEATKVGAPKPNPNWEGGRPPFPSSISPPSFLFYTYLEGLLLLLGKGGILLPEAVGPP